MRVESRNNHVIFYLKIEKGEITMSRFIKTIHLPPVDLKHIAEELTKYMLNEGFYDVNYKRNGTFYKKTGGWLDPHQYIRFGFKTGQITIEAFIKFPLFPGVVFGEMGITGSFCPVMKTALVRSVNNLVDYVKKTVKKFLKNNPGLNDYPDIYCTLN